MAFNMSKHNNLSFLRALASSCNKSNIVSASPTACIVLGRHHPATFSRTVMSYASPQRPSTTRTCNLQLAHHHLSSAQHPEIWCLFHNNYISRRLVHISGNDYFHRKLSSESKNEENKTPSVEPVDESKLSLLQRFKLMYKQYWYVIMPVHCVTSVIWYGSFFIAAKNGVDIVPVLKAIGVTSETILGHLQDGNTGYFAIAYAMYKVATPARYTVTLGCTTFSINYLKNRGYIKPVPSKEQLKVMYVDKRDEMKEKGDEMKVKFVERRGEILDKSDEIRGQLDKRRSSLLVKFKDQRTVMTEQLEERKNNLRKRLAKSSNINEKFEEKVDALYEIKKSLDNRSKVFTDKLEETKKILIRKLADQNDISKTRKK